MNREGEGGRNRGDMKQGSMFNLQKNLDGYHTYSPYQGMVIVYTPLMMGEININLWGKLRRKERKKS